MCGEHTVQDVAFQLERLVAGMYIYYRQSYRSIKPAAVFPIEVELGIHLQDPKRSLSLESENSSSATSPANPSTNDVGMNQMEHPTKLDSPPPSIDSLLLDLGLEDNPLSSTNQ